MGLVAALALAGCGGSSRTPSRRRPRPRRPSRPPRRRPRTRTTSAARCSRGRRASRPSPRAEGRQPAEGEARGVGDDRVGREQATRRRAERARDAAEDRRAEAKPAVDTLSNELSTSGRPDREGGQEHHDDAGRAGGGGHRELDLDQLSRTSRRPSRSFRGSTSHRVEAGLRELGPRASRRARASTEAAPGPPGGLIKRLVLGALSVGIIAATFAYFLPTIANYADVWDVVTELSWQWIVALARRHGAQPGRRSRPPGRWRCQGWASPRRSR